MKESEFIKNLAEDFFSRPNFRERLARIDPEKFKAFEGWLQIEFALELDRHPLVGTWFRELTITATSIKKEKLKKEIRADFALRQKNTKIVNYSLIEMKVQSSYKKCITEMLKDAEKVNDIESLFEKGKKSRFNINSLEKDHTIRNWWCLGVHFRDDPDNIKEYVITASEKDDWDLNPRHIHTFDIGETGYSWTLF